MPVIEAAPVPTLAKLLNKGMVPSLIFFNPSIKNPISLSWIRTQEVVVGSLVVGSLVGG